MSATIVHRDATKAGNGRSIFHRIMARFGRMLVRRRTHFLLKDLDNRLLRDIGLARADLETMRRQG